MAVTVPSTPVSSPAFSALGPVLISSVRDREAIAQIAEMQKMFATDADARIVWEKVDGRQTFVVVVKLGTYRAVISEVTPEIAEAIRRVRWRLKRRNHAIKCTARVDVDPASPTYLDVWLNPGFSKTPRARNAK